MRSLRTLLPVCLGLAVLMPAASASALPRCDEDERVDEVALERGASLEKQLEEQLEEQLTDTILPCAMLESGAVGPWCLDANVYVVTPSGVLLCRAGLTVFDVPVAGTPWIENTAPPAGFVPTGADAFALSGPLAPALPAPLALELGGAIAPASRPDRPHRPEPPWVPG